MIHKLKTWPEYYNAILTGEKNFEVRQYDRDYNIGDVLHLIEYDPQSEKETGQEMKVEVTYIMTDDNPFIMIDGFVIMSISTYPF
ncbi:hypothetical protein LCGC14_1710920 [marine sediment metagenome]|uniref:DUF3850 domain-containing protein n=1 Tax=marine sediment metagenome TaxID=412755 RepID=A0A0F9KF78_9ZZZZ